MSVFGFCKNKCKHDVYTTEETNDLLASQKNTITVETDEKLKGKSDTSHTHDDRYYTKTEIDNKLEGEDTTTYNLKARGFGSDGQLITGADATARITFTRRNGMIHAIFTIPPIETYGNIALFNSDGTAFSIPNKYVARNSFFPKMIDTFGSGNSHIFQGKIATGEITLDDVVIFNGTYISFNDLTDQTGQQANGKLYFMPSMCYMANN